MTAEEVAAMDRENNKGADDGKPEANAAAVSNTAGTKRKPESESAPPAKKSRTDTETPDGEEDEEGGS